MSVIMSRASTSTNNLIPFKRLRSSRRDHHSSHQNEEVVVAASSSSKSRSTRPDPFATSSIASRKHDPSIEDLSDSGQRIMITRASHSTANNANSSSVELHHRPVVQLSRYPSSGDLMRKDKGKDRERVDRIENTSKSHHREATHSKKHAHDESDSFTGSLAAAEFERLKKENESLKKSVKKQTKKIEEMKAQIQAGKTVKREHEDQVRTLKSKVQNNEEFIASMESALQCQICMDTYYKPFALAPCGHVYCLSCLQDWFKKAPASGDDMDIDPEQLDDPDYILSRQKTCPSCRGVITRRPAPLFMVNNIVSAFRKAKGLPTSLPLPSSNAVGAGALASVLSRRSTSPLVGDEDPWDGIFYEDVDSEEDDMEDEMESEYMYGYMFGDDDEFYSGEESYDGDAGFYGHSDEEIEEDEESSSGDDEDHDDSYVYPRWEPPSFVRGRNRAPNDSAHLALVRRGCTEWMINRFHLEYIHGNGLIAYLHSFSVNELDDPVPDDISPDSMNRLFLGWNVQRYDHTLGRRMTGKEYMRHILQLLHDCPERFVEEPGRVPGTEDVHMLMRSDETMEYDTTDSEYWA
ncbi:hypothetical protein D9758_008739 [Tetrapyrgos nigripes]|uniref:RING-type domain-containing protein n=1 Tax=Tetrapyrgos nigripes TaxID=182062 RepID=A0A8H5D6J9_9AGAR|nr:hypothetical protein D9758_008739 [Tetrapyrgos nigripes]